MASLQQRLARLERTQDQPAPTVPPVVGRVVFYVLGEGPQPPASEAEGAPVFYLPHNGREPRPAAPV